jgi:hypothetical protein
VGGGGAEERHDGIADVFVDAPAVVEYGFIHTRPERVDHGVDDLKVHGLCHGGEPRNIREKDGDQLPLLRLMRDASIRGCPRQFFAQQDQGDIGDVIAQQRSLGFDLGYCPLE